MYSANVNKNNRKLPVEMLIMLNFIRRQVIKTEITENQYVICMKQTKIRFSQSKLRILLSIGPMINIR